MQNFSLDDLNKIVGERASESGSVSYTAKLLAAGTEKCAEKLGEEATEAVIAAVTHDKTGLKKEAADVLYHLLVLLRAEGVSLEGVMGELSERTSQSGLEEKANRS